MTIQFNKMKQFFLILTFIPLIILSGQQNSKEKDKVSFDEHFFDAVNARIKGNFQLSNEYFFTCSNLQPESDVVLFKIAQNYYDLKKYDLAEEFILKAQKINPRNKWYQVTAIRIKIQEGKEAKEVMKQIEKFRPQAKNKYLIASLYRELFRRDQANKSKKYTEKKPENKNTTDLKNLWKAGKYKEVIKQGEKRLEKQADDPVTYFYMAKAFYSLDQPQKALEYLDLGIDFVIDNKKLLKEYYELYAQIYQKKGNLKKYRFYKLKIEKI